MFRRLIVLMAAALPLAMAAEVHVVEEIAAKVNGDIITKGDLEQIRREAANELRQRGVAQSEIDRDLDDATRDALRDKIDGLLLVQRAKDVNITVDSEVTRSIARLQLQSRIADSDKFAQWVREQFGVSLEEYKQRQKDQLLAQRVVQQEIMSRIFIPEADLKKYYEEHKSQYVRQDEVFLSQILLSTEGKTAEQAAAAETKAKDLVKRARDGEKFSELAAANSDDVETARNGGYLGASLKRSDLKKEIGDIVFAQKKGYVTDPIKLDSPSGFLILKVEERYEAGQATFEEVKDQVQNTVAEPLLAPRLRQYLTKLRQQAFLEIRTGYVDSAPAPGKDTTWHDVAEIKPQTTTKEEVAARRRKKFLWVIPYGRVGPAKSENGGEQPAGTEPADKQPLTAPRATPIPAPPAPPVVK